MSPDNRPRFRRAMQRRPSFECFSLSLTVPDNAQAKRLPASLADGGQARTRRARLTVLEQQAARRAGLLTVRTRRTLWRARLGHTHHVEANEPGQLVCLDPFYIGNFKGSARFGRLGPRRGDLVWARRLAAAP